MHPALWVCFACLHWALGCEVDIVSRADWGGRPPKEEVLMQMPVPHIFVHHTYTMSCNTSESCSRMMRGIQNFHMDERGWNDIGYNFLIGGDGRVYAGRGWDRVGAHTYGFNRDAVAFSLIGNFTTLQPPQDMVDAAKEMIRCAQDQNYVTENFRIHGHRDGVCTECPGQAFYDIIKTWDRFEAGPLPGYRCNY